MTMQIVAGYLKRFSQDEELVEDSVVKDFFTTAIEKTDKTKHCNREAVIAGIPSHFLLWAKQIPFLHEKLDSLKECVKGLLLKRYQK